MIEIEIEATPERARAIAEECGRAGIKLTLKIGTRTNRLLLNELLQHLSNGTLKKSDVRYNDTMQAYLVDLARDIHLELDGHATRYVGSVASDDEAVYIRSRFPETKSLHRCSD